MVEVVDLLSDSGEDEEIRPVSSPVVILDDPSPPAPAPSSRGSSRISKRREQLGPQRRRVPGRDGIATGRRNEVRGGEDPPRRRFQAPGATSAGFEARVRQGDAYFSDDSPVIAMSQRDGERLDKARERDRERAQGCGEGGRAQAQSRGEGRRQS